MFGRIHRVSHLGLKFLCWKHLATNSIFSMERELFRLFILNEFCIFQIIASFQLRFQNYGYKVVITFPYYPSTICGICSDVLPFTPDIDHLGCLFFLEQRGSKFINFIDLSKNSCLVSLMLSVGFLISVSLISAFVSIISLLLLWFNLLFFFSPDFLKYMLI